MRGGASRSLALDDSVHAVQAASPVSDVVALLENMSESLKSDQAADDTVYNNLSEWYNKSYFEKSGSVTSAQAHLNQLAADIEFGTGRSSALSVEIENLEADIKELKASSVAATNMRKQEYDTFNQDEKQLLESITALKAAITVLSKHHNHSLLQVPSDSLRDIGSTLMRQLQQHDHTVRKALTSPQRELIDAFVSQAQSLNSVASYDPQSAEIYGILQQLLETFESDLTEARQAEERSKESYGNLTSAKQGELANAETRLDNKESELATVDATLVTNKQDYADTDAQMKADKKAVTSLQLGSTATDHEYNERKATRTEEIRAIEEAILILTSDGADDTFSRTFNSSFLQTKSAPRSPRRNKVAAVLSTMAAKARSRSLSALAVQVLELSFAEVLSHIDAMIAQLLKQQTDEVQERDDCIAELHENELETERKQREESTLNDTILRLETSIAELTGEIAALTTSISDSEAQLVSAAQVRESQKTEFQQDAADQSKTLSLLQAAKDSLVRYYGITIAPSMAQGASKQHAHEDPPTGFQDHKDHQAGPAVIAIIDQLIHSTEKMQADGARTEEEQQQAYEEEVQATNEEIQASSRSKTHKEVLLAEAESEKLQKEGDHTATSGELHTLSTEEGALLQSCDFLMKNFAITQQARDEEVQALRQAKSILNGATFSS